MKASDLDEVGKLLDGLNDLNEAVSVCPKNGKGVTGYEYFPEDYPEIGRCIREMRRTVRRELRKLGVRELPAAETLLVGEDTGDDEEPGTSWINIYWCKADRQYTMGPPYGTREGAYKARRQDGMLDYCDTVSFNPYEKE